jgi:hypothetical protein
VRIADREIERILSAGYTPALEQCQ